MRNHCHAMAAPPGVAAFQAATIPNRWALVAVAVLAVAQLAHGVPHHPPGQPAVRTRFCHTDAEVTRARGHCVFVRNHLQEYLYSRHRRWQAARGHRARGNDEVMMHLLSVLNFDKTAFHHFAHALGLPIPQRRACVSTPEALEAVMAQQGTDKTRAPLVVKRSRGTHAAQVFILKNGRELLRKKPMTPKDVIRAFRSPETDFKTLAAQTYFRKSTTGKNIDKFTYIAEDAIMDRARRTFARDVKLHAFGKNVPHLVYITGRTTHGFRFDGGCLMCQHTRHGCVDRSNPVECYVVDPELKYGAASTDPRTGEHVALKLPPSAELMHRVAAVIGGALGVFVRVDFFEQPVRPVLAELTFFPATPMNGQTYYKDYVGQLGLLLGSFWKGAEGGGHVPRLPCWLPKDFEKVLMSCRGLDGRNVSQLADEHCTDSASDQYDREKWLKAADHIAWWYRWQAARADRLQSANRRNASASGTSSGAHAAAAQHGNTSHVDFTNDDYQ